MAAGIDPPARIAVHGFLLVGGEKMSKSALNRIAPADLIPDVRRRRLPLPLPPRSGLRSRRRLLLRGHGRPLQRRSGQQPRQPAGPGGDRGASASAAGIGPAPDPSSPLAAVAGVGLRRRRPAPGTRIAPSEALEATWRLVREANAALEAAEPWKAEPGPAVDAVLGDALEVLRIVAILASPALPRASQEIWRRIGLARPGRGPALAGGRRLGRIPGRVEGRAGRAALPADHRLKARPCGPTATATSRLTDGDGSCGDGSAIEQARAAGVTRMITIGTDAGESAAAVEVARAHAGRVGHGRAASPRRRRGGRRDRRPAGRARSGRGRRGRVRARLPLRPLAPPRAAPGLRRPGRPGRRTATWRWSSTPARPGTTPSRSWPRPGVPRAVGPALLHRRPDRGRAGPGDGGDAVVQRDRDLQVGRRRPGRRRRLPARPAAGRDRQPVSGPRSLPGPAQQPGAGAGRRRRRGGGPRREPPEVVEEATWANTAAVFRLPDQPAGAGG